MRSFLREHALCSLTALAGCLILAWLGLSGFAWSDYEIEAMPAFAAIAHGHVSQFLALAPAYGGSLVERAPFAALPGLWGGGALAVYRMVAVPCLLASAMLAVWLLAGMRRRGASTLERAVVLGLCAVNPIALLALEIGHPEELLGGCLCVGAVLVASQPTMRPRAMAILAGALLGLAIANKEWALVATAPVLLALAPARRPIAVASCVLAAGIVLAPLLLGSGGHFVTSAKASASVSTTIFQPWQVWWFFGHHGALVHGLFGAPKPGYRIGTAWASTLSHPLVILSGVAIAAVLWPRSRRTALGRERALLALALVLLARCLLDTWNISYYMLPFLLAVLAWEAMRPAGGPPVLALACTALAWASFHWMPEHFSPDVQAAAFLAWTACAGLWLAHRLRVAGRAPAENLPAAAALDQPQATTARPFGNLVSTS
jgi:hypothetical protein